MATQTNRFSFFAGLFQFSGWLIQRWPWVLVAAFFISPYGPHMRWTYSYNDTYGHR